MRFHTTAIDEVDDPLARDPTAVWMSPDVSLWGWGHALVVHPGPGPGRIHRVGERVSDWLADCEVEGDEEGRRPLAFLSFSFSPDSASSVALVPEVLLERRRDRWWLTAADGADLPEPQLEPNHRDRARYAGSSVPDVLWLEAVAETVRRIGSGSLDKAVLARDYAVWSREPFHPPRLLGHLRGRFPRCYTFRVENLVGASPELLLRRRGSALESLVLAGTAPALEDTEADARAGAALLASDKDLWEHELAVRSVREALESLTEDLVFPDGPELLRLDNVQHLASRITARADRDQDTLALIDALHPTAAVGGTPTGEAMALIAEIEGMDRGRYAGPVGWMDRSGDGEFAIALRCAELSGARARLFAGAGIVRGSLPEAELEETRIKLSAMMGALEA